MKHQFPTKELADWFAEKDAQVAERKAIEHDRRIIRNAMSRARERDGTWAKNFLFELAETFNCEVVP